MYSFSNKRDRTQLAVGVSKPYTYILGGDLDFSKIHTVNLDEYKGIDAENKQSYHYFMNQHLFSRVNIELQNIFVPDGMNENQDEECQRYEKLIAGLGGVDLQLLGLGHNGHIGFNEPAEVFVKQTHCVYLSEKTIQANQRFLNQKNRCRNRHIPWE